MNGLMVAGLGQGLGSAFVVVGSLASGTSFLVEGLSLKGVKLLKDHNSKTAEVGKIALMATAAIFAGFGTVAFGFTAAFATGMWFPTSVAIPGIVGIGGAALTIPIHLKAIKS